MSKATTPPIPAPGQITGYRVQLSIFEGPLDLLLHLIERQELDITRVSLALVADQYLDYLGVLEEARPDDLADFVVVAAKLLLIKSQALLPRPAEASTAQEEEEAGEDLVRQLIAYKRFKEIAKGLGQREAAGLRAYVRLAPAPRPEAGIEHLEPVSLQELLEAVRRALEVEPGKPPVDEVVAPFPITIDDQIDLIIHSLSEQIEAQSNPQVRFTKLLSEESSRQEVAVTFLALLELVKRLRVLVTQEHMFGEIVIQWVPEAAPVPNG